MIDPALGLRRTNPYYYSIERADRQPLMSTIEPINSTGDGQLIHVATFYRFVDLERVAELRARLQAHCDQLELMGTILLAGEGINATVSGSRKALHELFAWLDQYPALAGLEYRLSQTATQPFKRMKVRIRPEIVSFGQQDLKPAEQTGAHVAPQQWNDLLGRQDVRVLDTRNRYEVDLGSFEGAENPETSHFRAFADYVEQNLDPERDEHVAMFCTGGIRCEKASAWMLQQGFKNVYQLDGGILNYLEQMPEDSSRWRGECFVFDDRVTLDHQLQPTQRPVCTACRMPLSAGDMASPHYEKHISCPHCYDQLTPEKEQRFRERAKQYALRAARGY